MPTETAFELYVALIDIMLIQDDPSKEPDEYVISQII